MRTKLQTRLILSVIFAAILGCILINLPDAVVAVRDLFGV